MKKFFIKFTIIFLVFFAFFSCSKKKEETPTSENNYLKAKQLLDDKDYNNAAKEFEKFDDDFPFSKWAHQSQAMSVYCFYKNKDYNDVVRVVDDFIRINPNNNLLPYMYYMKSLSYYEQMPNIDRAQDNTKLASLSFRELIARFPLSEYSFDARNKIILIDEHIAGAKMSVGRYQMTQENFVGAIKNFHEVISRYRGTNQVPEAYYRLVEIYYKIGLKNEAKKARNKLEENFSQNKWTQLAKEIEL